jgi:hypothetical protein
MEVQQNNPEVQNDFLTAKAFIVKASKNKRGISQEIKWAIRHHYYSEIKLNNFLKYEIGFDYYSQGTDTNTNINKKLFKTVYGYSINKIRNLYYDTYNYDNDLINGEFNEILNYIWGFLRTVYNAYNRAHRLNKHYKLIKYKFKDIKEQLIEYIKNEYNPTYTELQKIIDDYIEDFDNHNIYDEYDIDVKEMKLNNLYVNDNPDADLYKKLIEHYKHIIINMVEEHNYSQN